MTAVVLLGSVAVLALVGLLSAVHAWYPSHYPTTSRCAAAVLAAVALLALLLGR